MSVTSVLRKGHASMRIVGEWQLCDDGVARPIVRVKVLGKSGILSVDDLPAALRLVGTIDNMVPAFNKARRKRA